MWRGRASASAYFFAFHIRRGRRPPESSRAGFGACARCSCHGGRSDRHPKRARRKAPGCRASRFAECPLRRRIPDICTENPRSALPPIAPVRRSMSRRVISYLRARCRPGSLRGCRRASLSSIEGSRRSAGGPGRMPPRSRCRRSSAGTWPIPRWGDASSRISCWSQARTSSCSLGSGISGRRCGHTHRA